MIGGETMIILEDAITIYSNYIKFRGGNENEI